MKFLTCNVCKGVWRVDDDVKLPACPKKGCAGTIKVTQNAQLFAKAVTYTLPTAAAAVTPVIAALPITTATLPKSTAELTQAYAQALFDALDKESGHSLPKSSEISTLIALAKGTAPPDGKGLGIVLALAKALIGRKAQRSMREEAMNLLQSRSAALKAAGTEEFYRLTMAGEAKAIAAGSAFAQSDSSMDKYKWFYHGDHHPLEGGGRTHRLTMTVPKGTIKLILDMAVPHEGPGLQDPIVSRDVAMFRERSTNTIDGAILARMTNEPGSFAVHEDVLAIFSKLLTKPATATTL
jgi:hypothetical protein